MIKPPEKCRQCDFGRDLMTENIRLHEEIKFMREELERLTQVNKEIVRFTPPLHLKRDTTG